MTESLTEDIIIPKNRQEQNTKTLRREITNILIKHLQPYNDKLYKLDNAMMKTK